MTWKSSLAYTQNSSNNASWLTDDAVFRTMVYLFCTEDKELWQPNVQGDWYDLNECKFWYNAPNQCSRPCSEMGWLTVSNSYFIIVYRANDVIVDRERSCLGGVEFVICIKIWFIQQGIDCCMGGKWWKYPSESDWLVIAKMMECRRSKQLWNCIGNGKAIDRISQNLNNIVEAVDRKYFWSFCLQH